MVTREMTDFGVLTLPQSGEKTTALLKVPAPLACYWLGQSEHSATRRPEEEE
ncbi:MAG: hypothetical protein HY900_00795 [Deltaproteobacteria bacterium]|nr:hypothetical protein [Deltaproteobacteria bacterium]